MSMPNLFVAGAPKCGTSSIHAYLGQHPDIFMCDSEHKEPQFFLYEGNRPAWSGPGDHWMRDRLIVDRAEYLNLFRESRDARYRGESSPYYLWSHVAQVRILNEVPDARFLIMLRDPVDRALSLWRHLWGQGRETARTVAEAMALDEERAALGWEPFWHYRELGLYGQQVRDLLDKLPREQLKVVYYDDFRHDAHAALSDVFEWLGVRPDVDIDTQRRFMETPRIAPTLRNKLLQRLVSKKFAAKRLVPLALRQRIGGLLLKQLASRSTNSTEYVQPPEELRARFIEDLMLLQAQLGDVPSQWFGTARATARR